MAFLIGGANSAADTAFSVANSCRFEDGDSAYMHKTCSSAFDTDKWTISIWFKRGNLGLDTRLISCDNDDGSNDDYIRFDDADQMEFMIYEGSSIVGLLKPNMVFRDVGAFYHLVCVWDSANGTAGNRMRMYVNGTEVTSFETDTNPTSGVNASWGNTSHPIEVGRRGSNGTQYFDGYIAEVAVCDGQAYAASDFGEFDEDSPTIWKPKDISALTFGTSGFYLDFEDSSNLGNDANGGTDFTEVNLAATDQATDTPTNNFATLNSLVTESGSTFSEGNCKVLTSSSLGGGNFSTIAASAGKWYAEFKLTAHSAASAIEATINVSDTSHVAKFNDGDYTTFLSRYAVGNWGILNYLGRSYVTSSGSQSTTDTQHDGWALNDIIGVALDCDNHKVYFSKGGGWQDAVDSWGGSSPDSYLTIQSDFGEGSYVFNVGDSSTSSTCTWECNFGGCSAFTVSSGNADANGYGNFEYAVPSGYYALCSKNMGLYGG